MGTVDSYKSKEVKRILKKEYNCRFFRQWKGSHENRYSPITDSLFTLAFHSAEEIARWTLSSALEDAWIDSNEFIKKSWKQR